MKRVAIVSGKVSLCLLIVIIGTASLWLWLEVWLWNMNLDYIAEMYTNSKQVFQASTMTRMILRPVMYTDTRSACSFYLARIRKSLKTRVFKVGLGKKHCFSAFACFTAPCPQSRPCTTAEVITSDLFLCPAPELDTMPSWHPACCMALAAW